MKASLVGSEMTEMTAPQDRYRYLAANLRAQRAFRSLRQADLVQLTAGAFTQTQISELERGLVPEPRDVEVLAEALGIASAVLLAPAPDVAVQRKPKRRVRRWIRGE